MTENWDAIIVGGSAAGLSAALLLGRARRRVLVVDDATPRNRFADHMHGVLGWEGERPADLLARGREDVSHYDVTIRSGRATSVDSSTTTGPGADTITVHLEDGTVHTGRALVAATGLTDEMPAISGFAEHWGSAVLHCPYCHGWEVRDQRLGMLALSPMADMQAQLIRQWSPDLTYFTASTVRTHDPEPSVRERLASRGVTVVDTPIVEILGDGSMLTGVRLDDGRIVEIDALFAGPTPRPNDDFLAVLNLDRADGPMGNFLAVDGFGQTSHPLVWAVGNVINPGLTVPMSIGAAAMTGGMVNMSLIGREFDAAAS